MNIKKAYIKGIRFCFELTEKHIKYHLFPYTIFPLYLLTLLPSTQILFAKNEEKVDINQHLLIAFQRKY